MAMIDGFSGICPRDKPWPIPGTAGAAALFSFIYQVLPLLALVDMPQRAAVAAVFILPATTAIFAAGVGYSHNKRLRELPQRPAG